MIISQPHHTQHHQRNLIIHGEQAEPGRYPYFTTLGHDCGGSLVAPDMILTAGHCQSKRLTAAVGRYSFERDQIGSSSSSFAGYYDVIAQARHPLWVSKGDDEFKHDFLLLKLNQTIKNRRLALLNDNPNLPNTDDTALTAMGVGWTHRDRESKADTLREVSLKAISNDDCRTSANDDHDVTYHHRIFPSHLCTTGGERNDRDAWCVVWL